jgi:crossover junction endodeoxyribonuclease RuvC
LIVLGIDPGSINTGWALLQSEGNKIKYISSGVLSFDKKLDFLERLTEIKAKSDELISKLEPDEIAFESLIFVKSPTALIKLAQTRGIILSSVVEKFRGKIFEYAPNLIKSTAVGHGHADKEGVRKFLDMMLGKIEYKTHDESDAVAIAICHIINKNIKITTSSVKKKKSSSGGLAGALAHKIG